MARGAATQRPHVVMIDNHPDAYPQTGLNKAAIVFEALAEFGVTRFMAVFAPGITPDVAQIGPVRSSRGYFVQWATAFHPMYAHAGGSPQALEMLASSKELNDLDAQFSSNAGYFWRSKDRFAPHNLYTSSELIEQSAADRGIADFDDPEVGFLFKSDVPEDQRPDSQKLNYFFIYREDHAGWVYDADTNGYLRLRRGRAAVDAVTGEQLWTKNVVVIEVKESPIAGDDKGRIEQQVIGSGSARVFMDGVERAATWRKDSDAGSLRFYDTAGDEIRLNTGPVWIVVLPSLNNLSLE